uniref:Secreted protein n=1 Tax=Mesocestoides corti TaxID=53468 RepID=A0A5K3G5F3_MESCO
MVLLVPCSLAQLAAVTDTGDPRNVLAAGSSRIGKPASSHTRTDAHRVSYDMERTWQGLAGSLVTTTKTTTVSTTWPPTRWITDARRQARQHIRLNF